MSAGEADLDAIVARVAARCDARRIYLFGSRAKGVARADSDVDLLVVGPSRLPRAHRGRAARAALAAFSVHCDVLFYTEQELAAEVADPCSFAATILGTARLVYPPDAASDPR